MRHLLILFSCLTLCGAVYAENPCQSTSGPYGPMTCSGGITPSISANGPVTMTDTIVEQTAQVNGDLTAEKVTFGSLTVNGKVTLHTVLVKGSTVISGDLSAQKTTFQDTLTISTNTVQLADCHTADLIIDNSGDGIVSPQILHLSEGSIVDGDVTFKAGDGIVRMSPDSKITGKVIGGKVVYTEPAVKATPAAKLVATQPAA